MSHDAGLVERTTTTVQEAATLRERLEEGLTKMERGLEEVRRVAQELPPPTNSPIVTMKRRRRWPKFFS